MFTQPLAAPSRCGPHVVHGHDTIKLPLWRERSVSAGQGPERHTSGTTRSYGRRDNLCLFVAKQTAVTGVRIQRGHADSRLSIEQSRQQFIEEPDL
jgi:hypothetical protein